MAIAYDPLMALTIPEVIQTYRPKNCILYALGVGLGLDSLDESELAFVYERSLKVLPTQACALGYLGSGICALETGIDWRKVVHGEQRRTLHRPLRPSGTVIGKTESSISSAREPRRARSSSANGCCVTRPTASRTLRCGR